jgi:DNA uptake protein ComE-like DNA-binding protein
VLRILQITVLVLMVASSGIPVLPQTAGRGSAFGPPVASPVELVDINHASLEQLLQVPGMTRSWAGRIVRFRPYRTKLDLFEEGVLPGEVYSRVKDYIIAHH